MSVPADRLSGRADFQGRGQDIAFYAALFATGLALGPALAHLLEFPNKAADIGGTNFRVGIVEFNRSKAEDLSAAQVMHSLQWRHANEKPGREKAMGRLIEMFQELIRQAEKQKLILAPLIGIGCPGIIRKDGSILRGGQNLPGNWESGHFNPPAVIGKAIPKIGGEHTVVLMHNDAVVQGLSQAPFMGDVKRWGVLTIGTGLGNARFTNRK